MRLPTHLVVRLTLGLLERSPGALARALGPPRQQVAELARALRLGRRERAFARALLQGKTNLWLFRVHQRAFAGDFVVVDMAPRPDSRVAWVLELKQGEPLRWRTATTHQLRHAGAAVRAVSKLDVLGLGAAHRALSGDGGQILGLLGAQGAR